MPESPYSPPKADVDVPARPPPPPPDVRFGPHVLGGVLFAYSFFLFGLFVARVFLSGGRLFNLSGALLGAAGAVAGLVSGWRLTNGHEAGRPVWFFVFVHGVALVSYLLVVYIESQATR